MAGSVGGGAAAAHAKSRLNPLPVQRRRLPSPLAPPPSVKLARLYRPKLENPILSYIHGDMLFHDRVSSIASCVKWEFQQQDENSRQVLIIRALSLLAFVRTGICSGMTPHIP